MKLRPEFLTSNDVGVYNLDEDIIENQHDEKTIEVREPVDETTFLIYSS